MFKNLLILAVVCSVAEAVSRSYGCVEGKCQLGKGNVAQSVCLASCGGGKVWPQVKGESTISTDVSSFSISRVTFYPQIGGNDLFGKLQHAAFDGFLHSLRVMTSQDTDSKSRGSLEVSFSVLDTSNTVASINNDESYSLTVETDKTGVTQVLISASNFYGAHHGLETLSQIVGWDDLQKNYFIVKSASVTDKPAFKYRGVMIDLSRNFLSPEKIRETLSSMGYNKMNVLHLHISDTASFPLWIQGNPNITLYGAYDDDKMYSPSTIADLVFFANSRGVMILPEIDSPAHISMGWQFGEEAGLGLLVLCADFNGNKDDLYTQTALEPPSGQINLANPNALGLLQTVYDDVAAMLGQAGFFHLGGDEVIVGSDLTKACYNSTTLAAPVLELLEQRGWSRQDSNSFYGLWKEFVVNATDMARDAFARAGSPLSRAHVWGGAGSDASGVVYNLLTQPDRKEFYPPSLFTIQVWDESSSSISRELLRDGYSIILSNTDYVYLDCGNAGFVSAGGYWCQPYHEWFHIYQYVSDVTKKWRLSESEREGILGSETLAWGEMIDDSNVSQKLWPRSAALAEALWSDPGSGWFDAAARMHQWRRTLVQRGVPAEALQPTWCDQRQDDACTTNGGTPQ